MRPLLLSILLLSPVAAYAQRAPFPIPDPDPEVERKSFIVADGFEVNLFAADPLLAKPIQINFDPQGRLWVASSEVYPQIQPGQKANDKILVLEDKDGDGKADTTTIFADGLLIPTGVEPGDGGAYVANSTEILHLRDTDGDGKADARRVALSGFGTEDTHHIVHTFRWGFDGQLYFNQSIYIHSHLETPRGVRRLGGGGIWEYRPETGELEVFIRGLVNPWGHHFDRWGQSFVTDGAGGEGINYALPGAYYFTAVDAVRILPGLNPGSPKDCGLEVVSGRHFPDDWQGNLLTNDFRGNRVCRYVISDDGAGFAAREQAELVKTKHVAFRPIDVKLGPDGAIYIADWYNPIIQHGEVDFRDPRRDHTRGRIWRVTAKGRPLVARPTLVSAAVPPLLDRLKDPEDWTRQQAKRVLKERGAKAVITALADWVKGLDPKDPEVTHQRLEALWTYQSLDVVEPDLLAALLRAPDPKARAAAVRVVRHWHDRLSNPVELLAERVSDDNPRVRLEAVRALSHVPGPRSAAIAMGALDRPVDRFLDYALWLTARETKAVWLPLVSAGKLDALGDPAHLVFALQAIGTGEAVAPLLTLIRSGKVPPEQEGNALTLAATLGQPRDLAVIFESVLGEGTMNPARRASLLDGLVKAARQRKVRPEGDLNRLGTLLDAKDESLRAASARAAGAWKVEALRARVEAEAGRADLSESTREAVVEAVAQLGGSGALAKLIENPARPVRRAAIAALATLDPKLAARKAVDWLGDVKEPAEAEVLVARFVGLKNGPESLANALDGHKIPADAAKLALRAARSTGRDETKLVDALRKAGGLDAARVYTADEKFALLTEAASHGDPARGEAVFRRKENRCLSCHAIAGAGGQVGPSLESIGASAPPDYLLDSLLEPGKAVKENYHALIVATGDGEVISGIKVRQTENELILRDADDRERAIALTSIEAQKPGGSLMPAGLTDALTRGELVDLVKFLGEMGKIGPYSVGKERLIRRWQVLTPTPANLHELRRWGLQTAGTANPALGWEPAYSDVSGGLPLVDLPTITLGALPGSGDAIGATSFARGQVSVSTPGPIRLSLNGTQGVTAWVDGTPVVPKDDALTLDLTTGVHTVTFAVTKGRRAEPLRCVLDDVAGSPARAQVVVGK